MADQLISFHLILVQALQRQPQITKPLRNSTSEQLLCLGCEALTLRHWVRPPPLVSTEGLKEDLRRFIWGQPHANTVWSVFSGN